MPSNCITHINIVDGTARPGRRHECMRINSIPSSNRLKNGRLISGSQMADVYSALQALSQLSKSDNR